MNKLINSKKEIIILFKMFFAVCVLYFLLHYGQLDFKVIAIVMQQKLLACIVLVCLMLGILISGVRWWILLRMTDIKMSLLFILKLQLIGSFFSTYLPGVIGGDAVRGVYICKARKDVRSKAIVSIVVDRMLSLFGLITVAFLLLVFMPQNYLVNEVILKYKGIIIGLFILPILIFLLLICCNEIRMVKYLLHYFNKYLEVIAITIKCYKEKVLWIIICCILSILASVAVVFGTLMLATIFSVSIDKWVICLASVFGNISSAIPLTPGGLGIGEAVFSKICIDLSGAVMSYATIYFTFRIGMFIVNIPGLLCYIIFTGDRLNAK